MIDVEKEHTKAKVIFWLPSNFKAVTLRLTYDFGEGKHHIVYALKCCYKYYWSRSIWSWFHFMHLYIRFICMIHNIYQIYILTLMQNVYQYENQFFDCMFVTTIMFSKCIIWKRFKNWLWYHISKRCSGYDILNNIS